VSGFHIIRAIEEEAHRVGDEPRAYELEILLRSGRLVRCAPYKANSYMLKVCESYDEPARDHPSTKKERKERITYIAYDAIDQVTPIWL